MVACGFPFCRSPAIQLGTVDLVPYPACELHSPLLLSPTHPLLPSSLCDSLLVGIHTATGTADLLPIALQQEERGLFEEAAVTWSQCLKSEEREVWAEAAYHLGYILSVFLEHAEEGIEYLRKAVEIDSNGELYIRAVNLLAQVLMDQTQEDAARDLLIQVTASNSADTPATIRSELLLGAAYFLLYDEIRAEYHLLRAADAAEQFPSSDIALEAFTFVALMRESVLFAERAEWALEQFTGNCEYFLLSLHFLLLHSHTVYAKNSRWGSMLQTFAILLEKWTSPLAVQVRFSLGLCYTPELVKSTARERALQGGWSLVKARNLFLYASILPHTDEEAYLCLQDALGIYQHYGIGRITLLHYFFLVKPLCLSIRSVQSFYEAVLDHHRTKNLISPSALLAFEVMLYMYASEPAKLHHFILASLAFAKSHVSAFCKMLQAIGRFTRAQGDPKLLSGLMPSLSKELGDALKGSSPAETSIDLLLTVSGMVEGWMSTLLRKRALGMSEAIDPESLSSLRCRHRLALASEDIAMLKTALERCRDVFPGAHSSLQLVSVLAQKQDAEKVLLDNIAYIRQHVKGTHYLAEAIMLYLGSQKAFESYDARPSLERFSETYEVLYQEAAGLYLSLSPKSSFAVAVLTDYAGMCQDFPERQQQLQVTGQRLLALHRRINPSSEAHRQLLRQWARKYQGAEVYIANVQALKDEEAKNEHIAKALCWLADTQPPSEKLIVLRTAVEFERKGEGYEALLQAAAEEHRQGREEEATELRKEAINRLRRKASKKLALLLCEEKRFEEAEESWKAWLATEQGRKISRVIYSQQ